MSTDVLINTISRLIKLQPEDTNIILELFTCTEIEKGGYFLRKGQTCDQLGF